MRKERSIIIKIIDDNKINYKRLAEFFAMKYTENNKDKPKEKS